MRDLLACFVLTFLVVVVPSPSDARSSFGLVTAASESADAQLISKEGSATIAGSIHNVEGIPVPGARVDAFRVMGDGLSLEPVSLKPVFANDTGYYELTELVAGDYLIGARVNPNGFRPGPLATGITWHLNSSDIVWAQRVHVSANQVAQHVNIVLQASPVLGFSGRILRLDGRRVRAFDLVVTTSGIPVEDLGARVRRFSDGRFDVADIAPGSYVVRALVDSDGECSEGKTCDKLAGAASILLERTSMSDVLLTVRRGAAFNIAIRSENPLPPGAQLILHPTQPGQGWQQSFDLRAGSSVRVAAGSYLADVVGLPDNWAIDSFKIDGRDGFEPFAVVPSQVLDAAIAVTTLGGRITAVSHTDSAPTAVVLARRNGKETLRATYRIATTSARGLAEFRGLSEGTYCLASIEEPVEAALEARAGWATFESNCKEVSLPAGGTTRVSVPRMKFR